ncbi:MAG TPA: hypothetical protein VN711_01240 [Candidatus Saccharimonadales bacterium]|nr:hypothetical protein [Candidatus Saccharimonadales bacterium]
MNQLALSIGGTPIPLPGPIQNISNSAGPFGQTLIQHGINILLYVAIILTLVFVLIGGMKWMLSQGDKKQVEEAQKTITYAVIGLIVMFLSFFIINIIGFAFGAHLIGNPYTGH